MVIIAQWRSWQMHVFTLTEQLEVSRETISQWGMVFWSLYDDSCTFQRQKDGEVKVLLGTCWLESRKCSPNFRVCLRLGSAHSHTPLSWHQRLSQGWARIQYGPIRVPFLSHVQSLGRRGWVSVLIDYQPFFLLLAHRCVCVCEVLSRVRSWDPIECSLPGCSVQGIFQARVLEWVVISFSTPYCCMEQNQLH